MHTLLVGEYDARISQIAERGLESAELETYTNGVRKGHLSRPGRQRDRIRRRSSLTETDGRTPPGTPARAGVKSCL